MSRRARKTSYTSHPEDNPIGLCGATEKTTLEIGPALNRRTQEKPQCQPRSGSFALDLCANRCPVPRAHVDHFRDVVLDILPSKSVETSSVYNWAGSWDQTSATIRGLLRVERVEG